MRLSLQKVAKGAFFLFGSTIVSSALGYAFWFIISSIGGPEIVGLASTTVSLALIIIAISNFGIPVGAQRFLGKSYGQKDTKSMKSYFEVELTIVGLATCISALLVVLFRHQIRAIMGLPVEYVLIVSLIIIARGLVFVLRSVYISLIRTKEYAIAEISGYLARLPVGIILVAIGFGGIGAALGYFVAFPITSAILLILYIKLVGRIGIPSFKELKVKGSETLKAGMANWPTAILITLGPQLGVIMVYGYQGASEAGLYYIAQAIMFVVFAIPSSIMAIMFPLLSGMNDERKRTMWRVIRVSLAISTPIMVLGCLYPRLVLGMLGPEYIVADLILFVLLLNIVPDTIAFGVGNLAYAYGNYNQVLTIGLARSLPRVILYLFLTPLYGGMGAAESFLVGSITALVAAYVVAYKLRFKINWMDIALIILVPALLGILIYLTELLWVLGSILILIISFFIYAKLRLITKNDLKQITNAFLPQKLVKIGIRRFNWVLRMLYGD